MSALNYLPGGGVVGVKPVNISAFIEAQKAIYGPIPLPKPVGIAHKKEAPPPIAKGEPLLQSNEYSASMSEYYKAKKALIEYVKKYEEKRRKLSKKSSVHSFFEKKMKQEAKLVSDTLEIFGYTPSQIEEEKRAIIKQIAEAKSRLPSDKTLNEEAAVKSTMEEKKKLDVIADMVAKNPALSSALSSVGPVDDLLKRETLTMPGAIRLGAPASANDDALSVTYSYILDKAAGRIPKAAPKPATFVNTEEHNNDLAAVNSLVDKVEEEGDNVEEEYLPASASMLGSSENDPAKIFIAKPGTSDAILPVMQRAIRQYFDAATGKGPFGDTYTDYDTAIKVRSDIKKKGVAEVEKLYKAVYERVLGGA